MVNRGDTSIFLCLSLLRLVIAFTINTILLSSVPEYRLILRSQKLMEIRGTAGTYLYLKET